MYAHQCKKNDRCHHTSVGLEVKPRLNITSTWIKKTNGNASTTPVRFFVCILQECLAGSSSSSTRLLEISLSPHAEYMRETGFWETYIAWPSVFFPIVKTHKCSHLGHSPLFTIEAHAFYTSFRRTIVFFVNFQWLQCRLSSPVRVQKFTTPVVYTKLPTHFRLGTLWFFYFTHYFSAISI